MPTPSGEQTDGPWHKVVLDADQQVGGLASAFGSEMSTPPCIIGAVIMKMIMSSIMTSISDTTLISAFSGVRSPRLRRRI